MSECILTARDGDIVTITLNRPDKLNALNRGMWEGLGETIRLLSANDSLRCIVLRGAGGKAFAAGADIAEFATERANARQAKHYGDLIHATMQAVAQCRHPTVALIEGACVGGGLEIAAMCDMRVCGTSSTSTWATRTSTCARSMTLPWQLQRWQRAAAQRPLLRTWRAAA
jgi:enoyl-CoA hydratase/carnithine racemase